MKKLIVLILFLLLNCGAAAQNSRGLFSGNSTPSTCMVGDVFVSVSSVGLSVCTATNVWTTITQANAQVAITQIPLGSTSSTVTVGNDSRLSDARTPTAHASTHRVNGSDPIDLFARVTGSNATTTMQTLQDATGLSLALGANTTYLFEANLSVSTTAVTTGTKYGIQFSTSGASVESQFSCTLASAASVIMERVNALNTANTTACLITSGSSGVVRFTGIITVGANAGNLTVQHLKVTSGTSTIFINSFLKAVRIA